MYVITYAIPIFPQNPTPNLLIKLKLGLIGTLVNRAGLSGSPRILEPVLPTCANRFP